MDDILMNYFRYNFVIVDPRVGLTISPSMYVMPGIEELIKSGYYQMSIVFKSKYKYGFYKLESFYSPAKHTRVKIKSDRLLNILKDLCKEIRIAEHPEIFYSRDLSMSVSNFLMNVKREKKR